MDRVYDVTIREVREKTVAVKASSKEEAEKGCRMYGPGTSEYDIQSVQYEAVERKQEQTFALSVFTSKLTSIVLSSNSASKPPSSYSISARSTASSLECAEIDLRMVQLFRISISNVCSCFRSTASY